MQPLRKIASNLLWTPGGIVRRPVVELAPDGRITAVRQCDDPDRSAATEFYAGLLVPGFPDNWRAAFDALRLRNAPLHALLEETTRAAYRTPAETGGSPSVLVPAQPAPLVILSGLDYAAMRLTERSEIRRIG